MTLADRPLLRSPSLGASAVIVLAVAVMMTPAVIGPMMLHDSFWIDYVWADQFTALLRKGELYPRWLPWSHDGLGSPVFYYYPPLAFYVTGAFGLAGLSTYGSILAAFALAFIMSGIGAYHWLRDRSSQPLLGALFFTVAPYHWFDFYGRGALAESIAIAFLPMLAIGLRRVAEGRGWQLLALAYAAMILCHLPLALLASIFLIAPYALFHRRRLGGFVAGCAIGIGLAAIYLLPALGLEQFRDSTQLWSSPHLRPAFWSIFAANWKVGFVAGMHLTFAILAVPALIIAYVSRDRWALYALAILAIGIGLVPFIWSLPLLRDVQFPYRILPLAELALAAAIARAPLSRNIRIVAVALPLIWTGVLLRFPHDPGPHRIALEQRHLDVAEYLPPGAKDPANWKAWVEQPRQGRIPLPEIEGWIVRPTFYFPGWSCGQPEPRTRLLMHRPGCDPQLRPTTPEKIGAAISLVALLILLFHLLRARRLTQASAPREQALG